MKFVQLIFVISTCISLISGHALMTSPRPFNPSPSTQQVCGGGSQQADVQMTLCSNKNNLVVWKVVAGDGAGAVTFKLDLNGGTTFDTPVVSSGKTPGGVGTFTFNINPGAVTSAKATLQAQSTSGWVSCSTVAISAAGCGNTNTKLESIEAEDLDFCTMINDHNVLLPAGTDVNALDASTQETYYNYLGNKNVFKSNSSSCQDVYKPFLCQITFPLNPGSDGEPVDSVCKEQCEKVKSLCQTTELHKNLYPCDTYPVCSSSYILFPTVFVLISALLVLLF